MKKVAVLGRGKSLEFLNSLPDVDAYVIANNWGLELNQQFIIDRFSDNKPIIHILSLTVFNTPSVSFDELQAVHKTISGSKFRLLKFQFVNVNVEFNFVNTIERGIQLCEYIIEFNFIL